MPTRTHKNATYRAWYNRTNEVRREQARQRYYNNHDQSKAKARKDSLKAYHLRPEYYRLKSKQYRYAKTYGITLEQRDALMAANGGMCALCGERPSEVIDHCHRTNQIRAALCSQCNTGLGQFMDDPKVIERALNYLRSYL